MVNPHDVAVARQGCRAYRGLAEKDLRRDVGTASLPCSERTSTMRNNYIGDGNQRHNGCAVKGQPNIPEGGHILQGGGSPLSDSRTIHHAPVRGSQYESIAIAM